MTKRWYVAPLLFLLTIPAANWMIGNVGTCHPGGPCTVPVFWGLDAPSGVLLVGLALALRDASQESCGRYGVAMLIIAGALLSLLVGANSKLALASAVAFLISEASDFLVYDRLRQDRRATAILASGFAGAVVDSFVFLLVAFGSLQYMLGQVVGKLWMTAAAAAAYALYRRYLVTEQERCYTCGAIDRPGPKCIADVAPLDCAFWTPARPRGDTQ